MRKIHQLGVTAIVTPTLLLSGPAAAVEPPEPDRTFAVTAGHSYTIGTWYQAGSAVRAIAYAYSAAHGWRKWFTGAPYGPATTWARLEATTPAVPAGTEQLRVDFDAGLTTQDVTLDDATALLARPDARPRAYRPALGRTSGLVTNGYAYSNPKRRDAVRSAVWEVTAGSLFAVHGKGYTGKIDDGSPGPRSTDSTGSAVFRMNTRRADFANVKVAFDLNIAAQTATSYTPAVSYDGVHIWLRHKTQYELYAASVARRDGKILIKKKCPGGPSNGGTYHQLGAEAPGTPIIRGRWRRVAATVQNNPSGSVTIVILVDGRAIVSAVDPGIGCGPITAAATVGIRGDNTRFRFDDFTVTRL